MKQNTKKSVHVMHVLGNFGMGGAEMGVLQLIQNFQTDSVQHTITIIGSDFSLLTESCSTIQIHMLNLSGRSYLAFWRLSQLFRKEKVDIVHVNNLAPWFDCAMASWIARCQCIETFHGVEQGQLSFSKTKKKLFQIAARFTTMITAVANPAAKLMADLTGVPVSRIEIIPNGIDIKAFSPPFSLDEKKALRISMNLPEKTLLFGCVAALRPVKNHAGLLRAFAKAVKTRNLKAELVLVGDGILEKDLKELSRKLGISEKVRFLGRRLDVKELLRTFDVFVLNSDTEGLSYAVLEAMASGLPIIATGVGANSDLIEPDVHGFLVPPRENDALVNVFSKIRNQVPSLHIMGERARSKVVETYSLHRMIDTYRKRYFQTIKSAWKP